MWNDQKLAIDWQTYIDQYGIDEIQIHGKDQKNMNWGTYLFAPIF
jgi:hypothetical protein